MGRTNLLLDELHLLVGAAARAAFLDGVNVNGQQVVVCASFALVT